MVRGDDRDRARGHRDDFDPIAEGAKHRLDPAMALAIWERIWRDASDAAGLHTAGRIDSEGARQRFHEVAARVALHHRRLHPAPGRTTRVDAERSGLDRHGGVFALAVPGRTTLVERERVHPLRDAGPAADASDPVRDDAMPTAERERLRRQRDAGPALDSHAPVRPDAADDDRSEVRGLLASLFGPAHARATAADEDAPPAPVIDLVSRAAAALRMAPAPVRMDRLARERTEAHDTSAVMASGTILLHPERFDPAGRDALNIVAHELVHVAQRDVDTVQVGVTPRHAEREAHVLAERALAGRPAQPTVRLTTAEAAHDDKEAPGHGSPPPLHPLTLQSWFGVHLELLPAVTADQPAVVGMLLQCNLRRTNPQPDATVFVGDFQLRYPSGHVDWSPSIEAVRLPIREAGVYTMRATVIVERAGDRQTFPIEHVFTAVTASSRAQAVLPGVADTSYDDQRAMSDIQHALLRPPGPDAQASGDYRIASFAPNPMGVLAPGMKLFYGVSRVAATPPPAGLTYHWYVRPLNTDTLHKHRNGTLILAELPPATLDGQPGFLDLGTGLTAGLPASEHNVFVIICRALDAQGQRVGEARYVQTVLDDHERRDLDKLEGYLDRSARLVEQLAPATRTALTAVLVAIDSATTTRLQLYAGPSSHGITLLDLTPGLEPKQHQLEFHGATFEAALASFRERNHHARGAIRLRIPAQNHLGPAGTALPAAEHEIETTGETQLEAWSGRFGLASLLLLGAAVAAAPFTAGGSVAVTLLLIGSAATGAIAAGLSLAERVQHAEISKTGVAIDIVGVVTSIVGGAAAFRGLRAASQAINVANQASRFVLWTNFVGAGIAAVLVSAEGVKQIQDILGDDSLSPDQRRVLLVRVVTNMALTGAMIALAYRDLTSMRSKLAGVLGAELEGALTNEARMTLSLLDEASLQTLGGPAAGRATAAEVNRLVTMLRADPDLVRRLAGRPHLLEALRLAHGDTPDALELGFLRVRLAPTVGANQANRIAGALERSGVSGIAAHDLGDPALLRISQDPERFGALHRQYGERLLGQLRAHPGDSLEVIAGRLAKDAPHAAAAGAGVFDLTNTRTLAVTGTSGATSTTVDGNLGPSHLSSDLRHMAGRPRAHGAVVVFDARAAGATRTTGHLTVPSAAGAPMTIEVEVRATSTLETPGGAAGPEPARLDVQPPDPASGRPRWRATITLSNRLHRDDVAFAVGRELDEAIDICRRNQRGLVGPEQHAVAFRPGAPKVTGAAQTTAADRATLHQLQELWADLAPRKTSLAGHERAGNATAAMRDEVADRLTRIHRLLRTMGLDDPSRFAERLPLLRAMGVTEAEWKPLQVMVEQRAFGALPHPGVTATHPVMTEQVIDHLLHPRPQSASSFSESGLYGGHQTSNLRQFVAAHPELEVVESRAISAGGTTYREYRQYRWKSTSSAPPAAGDPHRPGGAAFGTAEQAMWDLARVPKTTADSLQPFLRDAEAAWENWRTRNYTAGPPATGLAAAPGAFTTPANAAGVAFEGGFQVRPGPPTTWSLNTIYPKL
jgi:hypothetical protein